MGEKTYEYEVKWQFKAMDQTTWVEKDILVKMGYLKMVQREDERQAAMAGLMTKHLTQPGIEQHLGDFGVDPESASHTQINQLSGGMKENVATERWIMKGGYLRIEGESVETEADKAAASAGPDEVYDGAGNKIDVQKNVTLAAKDAKKAIKDLEKKLKDGKKKKTLTEEEMWEIEDKLTELKEQLSKE